MVDFNIVLKTDENFTEAYYDRAIALGFLKHYDNALENYNIYLKKKKFDFDAYYNRSVIHSKMKNYSLSVDDLSKCIMHKT